MQAIVLADGDVAPRARIDAHGRAGTTPVGLVIAADGGARHAAPLGLRLDVWVGDGDSVDAGGAGALEPPVCR